MCDLENVVHLKHALSVILTFYLSIVIADNTMPMRKGMNNSNVFLLHLWKLYSAYVKNKHSRLCSYAYFKVIQGDQDKARTPKKGCHYYVERLNLRIKGRKFRVQ